MNDLIFWEQGEPHRKINNNLTEKQALNIIDSVSLHCQHDRALMEDIEELKKFIKNG